MRIFGRAAASVALISLATAPAFAAPGSSASKLSLRAVTDSEHESNIAGVPIIAVIGIVAIVAGGVIIATQNDDPDSP
jgi:hypothetical protein